MKKSLKTAVIVAVASTIAGASLIAQVNPAQPGAQPAQPKPADAAPTLAPQVDPNKVVISGGGSQMTAGEFEQFVSKLSPEMQVMARGPKRRELGEEILKVKVLAHEAKRRKLDEAPAFKQRAAMVHESLLMGALMEDLEANLVTDDDVKKYYDDNKGEFEQISARHILIPVGPRPRNPFAAPNAPEEKVYSDEQAKQLATDLRKRLDNKEDFAKLAKEFSADPGSKDDGGELSPFRKGRMLPEFEKACYELKLGEISQPVRSQYGYHIIHVKNREAVAFDDVKEEVANSLREKKVTAYVEDLRKKSDAKLDESFFGSAPKPVMPPAPATTTPPVAQ